MKTITLIAAVVIAGIASVSEAQVAKTVSFADLNLGTPAGMAVVKQRIHRAAETVCGVENGTRDLAGTVASRSCEAKAIAAAMGSLQAKTSLQIASR